MKSVIFTLLFISSLVCFAEMNVKKIGVILEDDKTAEIELVEVTGGKSSQFLVRINGTNTELDEKVISVTESGGGTSATYYVKEDGKNLLRKSNVEFWPWEAYIEGKTFKLNLNSKKSKELKTHLILSDFNSKNKK